MDKVTYENDIRPLLREHCFACHNQDDATASLALDSFEGLTSGGASGEVVAAGDPEGSRLWKLVTHQAEPHMPPDDKLPEQQLLVLRAWIKGGLLKDANSKPLKSSQPAIVQLDTAKLGQPDGDPALPEQLFHEPVLWTPQTGPVDVVATSPWAPLVAVAWQRQVSFYDTNTHQLLGILPYVDGVPRVVRFSRDGSLVLVAGGQHAASGSAALFDVKTGARLTTLGDELDIVLTADISPDLSLIAIGGPKKKVRVYRVADGSLAYQIDKHTDWITAVGFSPDGRLLATADRNGGALLWQAATGHERGDLRGHQAAITALDWRADSAMLATASEDGTVRLWNPAGQQIKSIAAHQGGVLSVHFAKNGNWVTAGRDHKVKTWKPDGGVIADLGQLTDIALTAAFTHDCTHVAASDYAGEVRLIDVASKKQVAVLQANPPLLAQRFTAAETVLQQAQQEVQQTNRRLENRLAALDDGKASHAAHEKKLAKSQTDLLTKRQRYNELTELYAAQKKTLAAASEPTEQAEQELQATAEKQQAAEESAQAAAATVAQVVGESTGLPDLTGLTEQHEQAKSLAATTQQQLDQAQQAKAQIATQRARFAQASPQFANQTQTQQAQQQELAKQSGRLEAEHQQAANKLAEHRAQLASVASQLKTIQAKLAELESAEATFKTQEHKLATALGKIQTALAESQQQVKLREASKREFLAADALRKTYADLVEQGR